MDKYLLQIFFELYTLEPDLDKWNEANFEESLPQMYRLKIIQSILSAYSIELSILDFVAGNHINQRHCDNWLQFKEEKLVTKKIENSLFNANYKCAIDELKSIHKFAMDYRLTTQKLLANNSTVYAASGDFLLYLNILSKINIKLKREVKIIDEFLLFCINPSYLQLKKRDLIKNYNFPKVNLMDIDLDAM